MQKEERIPEKINRCHGAIIERRRGNKITLELKCRGDCAEGRCEKRSRTDHHGTTITWCSCDDTPGFCNIYLEKKHDGTESFECFTLGCGDDAECRPVEQGSVMEDDGTRITVWVCACVKKKPKN